ncbi:hypothetical protein AB0A94_09895 [Streptomyces sp. NPDC044984]|uniref:hypothetical protein n=1 Tax=Streptomyces sp. NPDC044984 TaxID=3154335 RepID=UPI0033E62669
MAADRFLVQSALTACAELLRRRGRIEDLRELGTGKHAHATLRPYARALEDRGRTGEAEAVLREFLGSDEYPAPFRWPLTELLARQGRLDDAVEMGRPTFDHHDTCLLDGLIGLLHEAHRRRDAAVQAACGPGEPPSRRRAEPGTAARM